MRHDQRTTYQQHPDGHTTVRRMDYRPPQRRWPVVLAACVIGGVIGAFVVQSHGDDRTLGQRIDATVATAQTSVKQGVDDLRTSATTATGSGATVVDRAAGALNDTGITAAVKTALAADPKLSAVKIDVSTQNGVVSLDGPAPDDRSRERAAVIAAAPEGVQGVNNRLVVVADSQTR